MGAERRAGQAAQPDDIGIALLAVDQNGDYAPIDLSALTPEPTTGPNDLHAPAANTAAIITYAAAGDNTAHCISGLAWSYAGTGTLAGGNIKIEDGTDTIFSADISDKKFDKVAFIPPLMGTPGRLLKVTLAAGGADVTGKVNTLGHWQRRRQAVPGALDFSFGQDNSQLYVLLF